MLNRFDSVGLHRDEILVYIICGIYQCSGTKCSLIADKFFVDFKVRRAGTSEMVGD